MSENNTTDVHGWLVGVELAEGVDPNTVSLRIADAINPVGNASVEYLGTIDVGPSEEPAEEQVQ